MRGITPTRPWCDDTVPHFTKQGGRAGRLYVWLLSRIISGNVMNPNWIRFQQFWRSRSEYGSGSTQEKLVEKGWTDSQKFTIVTARVCLNNRRNFSKEISESLSWIMRQINILWNNSTTEARTSFTFLDFSWLNIGDLALTFNVYCYTSISMDYCWKFSP